ncbi:MAG: DNA-binding protein [Methylothermaceae bacterium]|nr:DNA-binding protein [Methylothermaceae bacterium]
MARPGITKKQVFDTAQELLDEGSEPTVTTIRARLGSGSYSTISRFLSEWRDNQKQAQAAPTTPPSVETMARRMWSEAWRLAEDSVKDARSELESERRRFESEIRNLSVECDQKQKALNEAMERLQEAVRKLMEREIELEHLKSNHERLVKENAGHREQARRLDRENAALTRQLETAAGEIDKLQSELASSRERERKSVEEAAELRGRLETRNIQSRRSP